jgi:hypothetical protein
MTDVRDLGASGKTVFDTAQRLQKAGLIDDAQFKELTNSNVGPQDVAIANKALDKIQSSTPDAFSLMGAIPKMNNAILDIQKQQLDQHRAQASASQSTAAPAPKNASGDDIVAASRQLSDGVNNFMNGFLKMLGIDPASIPSVQEVSRNMAR